MQRKVEIVVIGLALALFAVTLAVGQDAEKGKAVFAQYCGSCHGATGKGDGAGAAALNPKPKDLTNAGYIKGLKDDYLRDLITKGGPAVSKSPMMPAMGAALKPDDVNNLIAFIRNLGK
jgi:mono/diheme cytochrome c family protein